MSAVSGFCASAAKALLISRSLLALTATRRRTRSAANSDSRSNRPSAQYLSHMRAAAREKGQECASSQTRIALAALLG